MRRYILHSTAAILVSIATTTGARAQCQLANPSFELLGQDGTNFAGWEQYGNVEISTALAPHGQYSARLSGNFTGAWNLSAYWQPLDSDPGERWRVAVRVGHNSSNPLTGDTRAILNVEWRDQNDDLIDYESHVIADASTPPDTMLRIELETAAAPAGTVSTRLLLGVLQGPTSDPGAAYYDLAEFNSLTTPTIDDIQWNDFPGGRMLTFADHVWRVKGPGYYGPGPSLFADSASHIWVDAQERLHMTIKRVSDSWYSTEIATAEPLGYGDYIFTTVGRPDTWDDNVVLGLFTFQYPVCWDPANPWNLHNEFDIELSRWNSPGNSMGQFVAQPWDYPGNMSRYNMDFSGGGLTSHAFRWLPDRIECRAWYGGPTDESAESLVHNWAYYGPHIPRPEQPRVHINFWQLNGPPASGADHEAIIDTFTFIPSCDDSNSEVPCFAFCLSGPDTAIPTSCAAFDLAGDNDTDLHDAALFQRFFAPTNP